MDLLHPEHPGRRVRLAYCLNMHAAEDLDSAIESMRAVTVPLRDRVAPGQPFGVGMYLPALLAGSLAGESGRESLETLDGFLRGHDLLPFTYNAFPAGGFQTDGLKADVYRPTWGQAERLEFTLDVARVASTLAAGRDLPRISISTHPGGFSAWLEAGEETRADHVAGFVAAARGLAELELQGGPRFVLSLEAEPRASCNDGGELALFLRELREAYTAAGHGTLEEARLLLGTCLDACHTAVEFEEPGQVLGHARVDGGAMGKLQFSSALTVEEPGSSPGAVARLLDLDEPRFLHQVSGRRAGGGVLQVSDLPELREALEGPQRDDWLACDQWRCHFHVPVDLADFGEGLGTTRDTADRLLLESLADPGGWDGGELHVEVETYTWSVLPGPPLSREGLLEGLEREYRHVLGLAAGAGWVPAGAAPQKA